MAYGANASAMTGPAPSIASARAANAGRRQQRAPRTRAERSHSHGSDERLLERQGPEPRGVGSSQSMSTPREVPARLRPERAR